jgi:hypothetical protein
MLYVGHRQNIITQHEALRRGALPCPVPDPVFSYRLITIKHHAQYKMDSFTKL